MMNRRTGALVAPRSLSWLVLPAFALLAAGCASTGPAPAAQPAPAGGGDVVHVGYGTQAARRVTGAVSSLVVTREVASQYDRVAELMQDRLPGVDVQLLPTGEYSVRIRGGATATDGGEPLFVVDGMPFPRGVSPRTLLAGLNPGDVARIDVLKDGAAAVYGSRAANGVILITTRRGPQS